MDRLRLRTGLAVLTVVAVLAVLVVGVPAWYDRWTRWRDSDAHTAVAPTLERADGALRAEAQLSVRYLVTGEVADRAALGAARIRADRAVRQLRRVAADAPVAVRTRTGAFLADWSRWRSARAGIDRRTTPDDRALEQLRELAAGTVAIADSLAALPHVAAADRRAVAALVRARAALADQQRDLTVALTRVALTRATVASLRAVPGTLATTLDPTRPHLEELGFDFDGVDRTHARTDQLARIAREGVVPFWTASDWERRAAAEQTQLDTLVRRALRLTSHIEAATRADAWDGLRNITLLLAGAIALVVATGIVVTRRIHRPVRALTRAVTHTADVRATRPGEAPAALVIPQVAVRAAGDTGALAAAVAELDRATLDRLTVATGAPSADPLALRLVRRNEPLLAEQLALLEGLMADEPEPARRRSLAQADRLGTRMRRHGEQLLVAAGLDPERRAPGAMTPVELVRAAVGEIEHFARIDVAGLPDDVTVSGAAARDLVHVLAELLDNAANFSGPDTRVSVRSRRRTDGIELTVADDGDGIPVTRLDAYNELLTHPPRPGLERSRALGLAVVARLSERIGTTVRLRSAPGAGTSAVVSVPASLLAPVIRRPGPVEEPATVGPMVLPVPGPPTPPTPLTPPSAAPAALAAVPAPEPEPHDDGVHFTAVPVTGPGELTTDGIPRPAARRGRRRPSTGTLHRAPAPAPAAPKRPR